MTPEQITLVQESFAKVEPIADKAAELFYGKLFELDPSLKPMFKGDIAEQGTKLMTMIGVAVRGLTNLEAIVPAVQNLGIRHVDYGVKDEHYDTVAAALLWTLEQGLGDAFTEETKAAWTETYVLLATVMKEAAATVESA
ncbi:MAG: hemin receptor [Oceanospirillaceae bacterium]|nr:hemin receptor [Oceanospirillaceae bacterium]|tara:strand:- start:288 stop:707 length:420 start_codon:yes stop_codon:yes gene_type:complete